MDNIEKSQEMHKIIQTELKIHNLPLSDLYSVADIISDFDKKHKNLKERDHSIYFILLLVTAYKAGRESGGSQ